MIIPVATNEMELTISKITRTLNMINRVGRQPLLDGLKECHADLVKVRQARYELPPFITGPMEDMVNLMLSQMQSSGRKTPYSQLRFLTFYLSDLLNEAKDFADPSFRYGAVLVTVPLLLTRLDQVNGSKA
jgi:hypothetical protein